MTSENTHQEAKGALLITLCAFLLWGFLPLYLKQMHDISPWAIVGWRVIWTVPWAIGIAIFVNGFSSLKTSPKNLAFLALSGLCISGNWTIYTWCVANGLIMETALGYFINPLMNVAIGIFVFKEKLAPIKLLAVGLAGLAVVYQSIAVHHFPLYGLILAALFTCYALIRKKVIIAPAAGLFWESLVVAPFAIAALIMLNKNGVAILGQGHKDFILLLFTGPATAIPLTLFAFGARRLKMTTLGMLQYIAPSIVLIISLFYGERFGIHQAITFGLIWGGLALYSWAEFKGAIRN